MIDAFTLSDIEQRMARAQKRYGDFASTHEALGVATEEWHELIDAIRSNIVLDVHHECLDLAAVLIRLAMDLQHDATAERSGK